MKYRQKSYEPTHPYLQENAPGHQTAERRGCQTNRKGTAYAITQGEIQTGMEDYQGLKKSLDGKITLQDLVSQNGRPLTLAELRKR
jgi:hypothetical protein